MSKLVLEASKQTDVSENTIRNWIEDNLITTIGTRGIVSGGSRGDDWKF